MESLAIKFRPKTFEDVVEQGNIKLILKEQIKTNTQKNCYLFTGGAGTGKTTCARIFANELNEFKGNTIEIDAASNNGVDQIRDIIKEAKFKSIDSKYKIYILDEVHMLSTGAWNAMLKLIEEPPKYTIFIFCTTDPQKIPNTILSRVQRYDFQRITFKGVTERLRYICEKEGVCLYDEDGGLEYIAKLADGGMRDAITYLDKCISYSPKLLVKNIVQALGSVNYDSLWELSLALYNNDSKKVITMIEEVHRDGVDLKQFMKLFSNFILDICKYQLIGNFDYLQTPNIMEDKFKKLGGELFYKDLLQIIINLNNNIKWDMNPKPLIEATLINSCNNEVK